jgi:hypothetical protein
MSKDKQARFCAKCGHTRSQHPPVNENYDAPLPCEVKGCGCEQFQSKAGDDEPSETPV